MPRLEVRELCDFLADLHGQFARRAEDEGLRGALVESIFSMRGEGEGGGLAGAGLREAEHVRTGEGHGDRHGLDGRGLFEAKGFNGGEKFLGQAEFGERKRVHMRVAGYRQPQAMTAPGDQ